MIVCAGDIEDFKFATPIGVGLMKSAIKLTKICLQNLPKEILFVGSAGSYGDCKIGQIYESSLCSNVEIGFFDNLSYTPLKDINVSRETSKDIVVNSSNYITSNKLKSEQFLHNGYDLENMEFFAVRSVAKSFNLKFKGIFYVTNYCDENAHEDFIKNFKTSKKRLFEYIKDKKKI